MACVLFKPTAIPLIKDAIRSLMNQTYHPSRVLTIIYLPFSLVTTVIPTHNESRINTRTRVITRYTIFFICTLLVLVVFRSSNVGKMRNRTLGLCALSASFGVAYALVQGSMVGDMSFMCPEFIQVGFDDKQHEQLSNSQLFLQNTDYGADLFLIYVLTLSIVPGFLYENENTGSHQLGKWYALLLIAVFNVSDLISRYIPLIKLLKLESRKCLLAAILSRLLLIPAFYFTAKYADQGWMILLVSFLGLTNGYLTVCVLIVAPKGYKGPEQNALGNFLVLILECGIFVGDALDWLWLIGKSQGF
ncbi:hypothetical protein TSUD_387590 [Trifolium subterraneum]|uniref:Uncharacterized protein n=1 Tax=Trifolium subterraneum TaxID=3900 RepID=A0A2Z6P2D4_TRISU|nr:hypothetical protein TSUD_387590 [Trifolium subterraneum]